MGNEPTEHASHCLLPATTAFIRIYASAQTDRRLKITEIPKTTPKHIGIAVYKADALTQTKYIETDKSPLQPPALSLYRTDFDLTVTIEFLRLRGSMKFSSKLLSRTFIPCLFLLAGGCTKTESGLTGVGLGSAVGAGIGYAIDGGAGGALAGAALGGIAGGAVGVATNNEDEEPRTSKRRRIVEEVPSSYRSEDELEQARTEIRRKRLERETLEIENEKKRLQLEKKRLELEEAKLDKMKRQALQKEE